MDKNMQESKGMDEVDDHYRATNKNASKPDNRFDHGDRDEVEGQ